MKISVVTPVRNGERFIRQTIESVLSQKGEFEIEYIIRDGKSTDGTIAAIREYSGDPRLTLISAEDRSLYDAINKGMAIATGDIGCWISADDCFVPGAFQSVVDAFRRHPQYQWLYGHCNIIDERNREIRKAITLYKKLLGRRYSYRVLLCENYINQPATFWEMNLWRKVGGASLDYPIAADYHLWLLMAQQSSALPVHRTLACFRRCGESISERRFEQQFTEELDICSLFAGPVSRAIHRFNRWKIITAYRLMSWRK